MLLSKKRVGRELWYTNQKRNLSFSGNFNFQIQDQVAEGLESSPFDKINGVYNLERDRHVKQIVGPTTKWVPPSLIIFYFFQKKLSIYLSKWKKWRRYKMERILTRGRELSICSCVSMGKQSGQPLLVVQTPFLFDAQIKASSKEGFNLMLTLLIKFEASEGR